MFPLIPIAMGLVQAAGALAPTISGWLGGPKAADVAQKVVNVATAVTGVSDPETASAMIQADPAKAAEFQKELLAGQAELAKIANEVPLAEIAAGTADLATVNATMQAEGKSEHWPQWSWRPYLGFSLGSYVNSLWVLPIFHIQPAVLPSELIVALGAILGVASWGRSSVYVQRAKAFLTGNKS